jgi:hypothetical protein
MKKYEVTLEISVADLKELLQIVEKLSEEYDILSLDRIHFLDRLPIMDNPLSDDTEEVVSEEIHSNSP